MPFDTPLDIRRAYENGLPGTPFDAKELDEFLGEAKHPLFGAAAYNLEDSGKGKLVLLHKLIKQYDPKFGETEKQDTGDCTSHGTRNAADLTRAAEIVSGEAESFLVRSATEPIYGARGHSGQGMSVVRAARFVTYDAGLLLRKNYEDLDLDLSEYNARIGMGWGGRGVPSNVIKEAKKHSFQTASLVTTVEEARDAIANGYALTVGSNYGFSSRRDKNGIAKRTTSWNHCFTEGAFISGAWKEIQEIKEGDYVYTHSGNRKKVTRTNSRIHNGEFVKIKVWGLPEFEVTGDHPILIMRDSSKVEAVASESLYGDTIVETEVDCLIWIKASDLKKGDKLVCPSLDFGKTVKPDFEKPTIRSKSVEYEVSDELAWLFGLYIADGNSVDCHKSVITLSLEEKDIAERASKAFGLLGKEGKVYKKSNCYKVICYSSTISHNMIKWFGSCSAEKQIPEFLFTWNLNSVIDGIFTGDGCWVKKQSKRVTSVSKKLIYQMYHALINIGENPTIYKTVKSNGTYKNAKDSYAINWYKDVSRSSVKNEYGYLYMPVKSVEKFDDEKMVFNFSVENDFSYISNGIVSHNCMAWAAVDDTRQRLNETLFLVINSWGRWNSGPKVLDQPEGSFWIRESDAAGMLRQRQAYALSSFDGFPPQKVDFDMFDSMEDMIG
jgi:intein/homing endonuclease